MDKINEEMRSNKLIRIVELLGPALSNTVGLMLCGIRYEYNHPIRKTIDEIFIGDIYQNDVGWNFFSWISYFPEIFKLFLLLPTENSRKSKFFLSYTSDYIEDVINDKKKMSDGNNDIKTDDFTGIYLKRLKEIQNDDVSDDHKYFSRKFLKSGNI